MLGESKMEKKMENVLLPIITIELRHLKDDTYESRILSPQRQDILRCEFTLKEDDSFLAHCKKYLEEDCKRKDKDVDPGCIQRMGKHLYDLITNKRNDLKDYLRLNKEQLKRGFSLTFELDSKTKATEKKGVVINEGATFELDSKTGTSPHSELLWHIPWEYLHDGDEFLSLSGRAHLSRKPIGLGEVQTIKSPMPLRLLVVVASPSGLRELNTEKEIGIIQELVDEPRRAGYLEVDYLEIATLSNIRSKVKHFKPHILHYTGHGGKQPDNETYLACEDDDGNLKPIFGNDLRRITQDSESLQLVVLSGCMTAQTHHQDTFKGVATSLLQDSLPAVLGMQYSMLDKSGIEFAKKFYGELTKGSSLLEAVKETRFRLYDLRGYDRADWGLPVLYLRAYDFCLIDTTKTPTPKATAREQVNVGGLPVVRGFVGRKREISDIRQAINHPQIPVVYIYGLGGVGKTALTAKIIEKVKWDNSVEAVCVIKCNTIEPTFANVIESLADFISLQGEEGHAKAGQLLRDSHNSIDVRVSLLNKAISEFRYLFVFDNFESLFAKQATIGELQDAELTKFFSSLLSHNWHSTFIFTCRYDWQLLSECGLPTGNLLKIHLPGLTDHQSIQYMNNLDGPLSRLEYKEQLQLLPLVTGHPKTIELLDSYLKEHTVSQVLEDTELRGKVIEDVWKYFMDSIYKDLNKEEQEALSVLAIFRRPLKSEDIQRLVPQKEALPKLRGYSLLQIEGEGRGYVVHSIVSEYVLSQIGKEETKRLHKKAAEFYIHQYDDLLKIVPEDMKAEPLKVICGVMEMLVKQGRREEANAMTSLLLEIHHHLFSAKEYEQASDIVSAIWEFLDIQGLRDLAKELLKKSIESLEGGNKYVALGNLATWINDEGKWEEALKIFKECLEFFRQIGAKPQIATVIGQQAKIYQERGKYEQALSLEQKGLALDEEIGNKEGIVISYYRIAQLLHRMKKYDEALKRAEEGLKLAHELENQRIEAAFLHLLGGTLNELNRPKDALEHFSKSLAISQQIGDKAGQADSLGEIGKLFRDAGQFKEALDCFEQALDIHRELGDPIKVAIALEAIGVIFKEEGHYQEALIKYQESLDLKREYSAPPEHIAVTERNIARVKNLLNP